jgi:hypothetical protein
MGNLREGQHARPANAAKEQRSARKRPGFDPIIHIGIGY